MDLLTIFNSQTAQDVVNGVKDAISKLGEGATYIAQIYIRQQAVAGIQCFAWSLIGLVSFIIALITLSKRDKDDERDSGFYTAMYVVWVAGSLALFIGLVADGVGRFINPEYYAIQDAIIQLKMGLE